MQKIHKKLNNIFLFQFEGAQVTYYFEDNESSQLF